VTAVSSTDLRPAVDRRRVGYARIFWAMISRDVLVTRKEVITMLAQGLMQPLFLLFVFGRVLTDLGYAQQGYAQLLFPGIIALSTTLTALQSSALPLVLDFSFSREIDDRLLAPMPTLLVAVEKIVFAALRALTGAVLMFPIGLLVLGEIPWRAAGVPLLIVAVVLGSLLGSSMGVALGTFLPPTKINVMFALILTPLLFTGATQYPWPSLDRLRWFQVLTACNPLTYFSEAMRTALVPGVPHLPTWISVLALLAAVTLFGAIGIRGFQRRAMS
jgi:ABC-2 type transport system permease protein